MSEHSPATSSAAPALQFAWSHRLADLGAPYVVPQQTTPVTAPHVVAFNPDVAALLDLPTDAHRLPEFAELFAGNQLPAGARPVAHRYAGHQFGVWAGQLGDGRAVTLGGVENGRGGYWEIQLKGAGQTPFSRFADGRAVLRSTIREYLVSEAMAGLGIPTTRALAIVGSDAPVYRETVETAAILTRVTPDLIRFGSFEWLFYAQRLDELAVLADHVINGHVPQLRELTGVARYRAWLDAVIARTAELMAAWQAVGFVHGVMNTDNMSVLGLTIDYGPFAFMEGFRPDWAPNHTDTAGRYAYDQQPQVGLWNLGRFAQAILPLLAEEPEAAVEVAQAALGRYEAIYEAAWLRRMRAKLGLRTTQAEDADLIQALLTIMARGKADFTRVFRGLSQVDATAGEATGFVDELIDRAAARSWLDDWRRRVEGEHSGDHAAAARQRAMAAVNPKFVLRTHLAQHAIERAQAGDYAEVARLQDVLRRPFAEHAGSERDARPNPDNAAGIVLSCSS